ncbi:alpha-mannosyltransferase SCDLUD_002546 [Saccharomycodes ludwigii]|uniref:alpha-mannosyltransferase n=1 Tax=Saccharomycodes ludwigii TaxID=36035 RepID=UPI001E82697D|nr:hypothetical protein SCDLUD_002546 [Saccharomycodes ludwigii]KAH3901072.1 hypothetical protein SCDLUD_002546 [Saccharomycodes ludwigii]
MRNILQLFRRQINKLANNSRFAISNKRKIWYTGTITILLILIITLILLPLTNSTTINTKNYTGTQLLNNNHHTEHTNENLSTGSEDDELLANLPEGYSIKPISETSTAAETTIDNESGGYVSKFQPGLEDVGTTDDTINGGGTIKKVEIRTTFPAEVKKFIIEIFENIRDYSPSSSFKVEMDNSNPNCKVKDVSFHDYESVNKFLTKEVLSKGCLKPISTKDLGVLQTLHGNLKKIIKDYLLKKYKLLVEDKVITYNKLDNTESGIVIMAGGKYSLTALGVLKSIRENSGLKTRNSVPVEIFFPPDIDDDQAIKFCTEIIPKVDNTGLTSCTLMSRLLPESEDPTKTIKNIQGYQYKAMSILFSKFQKVLFLDADNYVVNPIDGWFNNIIFERSGLILWPDFWRRVHHPWFYTITGLNVDENRRVRFASDHLISPEILKNLDGPVPYHDYSGTIPDLSSESGQLLIDKNMHMDTLILSLYYNINGPNVFYPLLGQGGAGQGDKDTFAAAAFNFHGLNKMYQVRGTPRAIGYHCDKNEVSIEDLKNSAGLGEGAWSFRGVGILQSDFTEDYKIEQATKMAIQGGLRDALRRYLEDWGNKHNDELPGPKGGKEWWAALESKDKVKQEFYKSVSKNYSLKDFLIEYDLSPKVFVHSNLPKLNPLEMGFQEDMVYNGKKFKGREGFTKSPMAKFTGHFRMYELEQMKSMTNYDLELATFKLYNDVLCTEDEKINDVTGTPELALWKIPYLYDKFTNDEELKEGNFGPDKMCLYIKDRYTYLKKSTWESSRY